MLAKLFSSLRNRRYRRYFLGQAISIAGTWMQRVAQAWLVYRLTDSSFMLGLVSFAGLAPVLLLGLPAGMLLDYLSRRRLLILTQALAMIHALALAFLVFTGRATVWNVLILAVVLGVLHAVELPARHAFLAELVPRADLANAIALNSTAFNTARFAGPALAGWLVGLLNEGLVFLINAVTFALMVWVLLTSRPSVVTKVRNPPPSMRRLFEGLAYARRDKVMAPALWLLAAVALLGTAHVVLMPVFSNEVFGGGPELLGLLLSAAGAGALAAALRLAYLGGIQSIARHIGIAALAGGLIMVVFSRTEHAWGAFPVLFVLGYTLTTVVASVNTLIQLRVPDHLRGRVMALFSVLFIGLTSLGNLMAGSIASILGAPNALLVHGALCLLCGIIYFRCCGSDTDHVEEDAPVKRS